MPFMPWTNELITGIEKLDEQHKCIVDATNQLGAEISKKDVDRAVVGRMLRNLVDHTFKNFITEEDLFDRLGYPERDAHFVEHNMFTDNITTLLMCHNKGESVSIDALNQIEKWLLQHITNTDKAYVPFFKQSGVS